MFKGTTADNSSAVVGLTRIGVPFAPTMSANKTFVVTQNLTSGNTLDAGQFLLVTAHVTSFSKTSYPNIILTLDGQYR